MQEKREGRRNIAGSQGGKSRTMKRKIAGEPQGLRRFRGKVHLKRPERNPLLT